MATLPDTSAYPYVEPQPKPKRGRAWLKWLSVIVSILVLLRALVALGDLFGVLGPSYGTKIDYKAGELYYTEAVTEAEAKKVGDVLQQYDYFNDQNEVSVQLHKVDGTYQLRFVVQPDKIEDASIIEAFTIIGTLVREAALDNAPTVVHLTDDELETIKELKL